MEPTLPVWTVRPNWKGGVLERLEWLTNVLMSSTGAEQRRALRLSPRRSVEITINPTQNERTFVDLLLHKLGSNEWLFPLWFDKARLSVAAELGADRIDFDNTFREFTDGGLALIYKDAFTWEVISIAGQDDTGLDLALPLDGPWGKNVAVYPLRQARLQNETELRALSSRVGESVLLWTITEANDYPEEMPDAQTFEGMPVLTIAPNRSQDITVNHTRLAVDRDNQVGIPYRVDSAGRAFQVQSHSWMLVGRQAQAEFRSMLYWLRGRQRAVWLPSFNEDIVTSRASANASTNLDIQKIGIAYAGGVIPGRDVVRVNGIPARITALGAPQSPQEERLRIGAGLTAAVPAGRRGSFMSPARLNQDGIEILHHADTNGAAECSTTFKSFSNSFPSRSWWRIRFIAGEGSRYRLRNLEFRTTAAPPVITPCGTRDQCRATVESQIAYTEQAAGTFAADLWLYGSGGDGQPFGYWASNEYDGLPTTLYIARNYPAGRDSPYVGLIGVSGTYRTEISRFAIEWSDDGANWTTQRIVDTDPDWGPGETRVFFIY